MVIGVHTPEFAFERDLGNIRNGFELVTQKPILDRSQLPQIVLAGSIDEGVLVDPADSGGVGAE